MRISALFVLILSLTLAACGGGKSPSSPTPGPTATPTPTPGAQTVSVRVFSGWDDMPISGASIATPAGRVTTSASGEVSVSLRSGDAVDFSASGHRDFNTAYRGESPWNVYLWNTTVVSGEYIDALVYNEWVPGRRLSRPAAGNIGLAPSAEMSADARVMDAVNTCASAGSEASGSRVSIGVGAGGVQLLLLVDSSIAPAFAVTSNTFAGNAITASRIRFRDTLYARNTIACHELGHVLGLGHSISRDDTMDVSARSGIIGYRATEAYVLKMMFRRRPGTASPDNDRDVTAALSTAHSTVEIDCPLSH